MVVVAAAAEVVVAGMVDVHIAVVAVEVYSAFPTAVVVVVAAVAATEEADSDDHIFVAIPIAQEVDAVVVAVVYFPIAEAAAAVEAFLPLWQVAFHHIPIAVVVVAAAVSPHLLSQQVA
jgi:hypothetical protein